MLSATPSFTPLRRHVNGIRTRWCKLIASACDPYRPELHHMRGPDLAQNCTRGIKVASSLTCFEYCPPVFAFPVRGALNLDISLQFGLAKFLI